MTLVVTDVSRHGVVAVGDSALTIMDGDSSARRILDSVLGAKIFYSYPAKISLAAWGNFGVNGRRLDYWLADYTRESIKPGMAPKAVATDLAEALNVALEPDYRPGITKGLRRGVQVAGFAEELPELYHVHMGEEGGPHHELKVHQQPLGDDPQRDAIFQFLARSSVHLRNGMWRRFVEAFDRAIKKRDAVATFDGGLESRCEFFSSVITDVANGLKESGQLRSVNSALSAIAFNRAGVLVDMRIPVDGPELIKDLAGDEQLAA